MLNFVATLQQRRGNVFIKSESDVGTTLIFDGTATLWQRQQRRCDNVVTTSLCQLGIIFLLVWEYKLLLFLRLRFYFWQTQNFVYFKTVNSF